MNIVIGLNAYHADSSAAIYVDGVLIAAAEEERFNRVKHFSGVPVLAVAYCLKEAGIKFGDISTIAINQSKKKLSVKKFLYLIKTPNALIKVLCSLVLKRKRNSIVGVLEKHFCESFTGQFLQYDHHLCHMASAFLVSPYETSAILSVDGFGDFKSTVLGGGNGTEIKSLAQVDFPHSLGILYQAITQWLGFSNYGDEYKVMGLAPYGAPVYKSTLLDLVNYDERYLFKLNMKYFRHGKSRTDSTDLNGVPRIERLFTQNLVDLIGESRDKSAPITQYHIDMAASVQAVYEEILFNILNRLYEIFPSKNLCLAGGCAMNSVANGKISLNTPYKNIYIQSAAGDAGGAIGAAALAAISVNSNFKFHMKHSYWGPSFSNEHIDAIVKNAEESLDKNQCIVKRYIDDKLLCQDIAKCISEGQVVGWFNGRMEWGPRALGNRSILGDPRRADMKDILNLKIKRRESFRPFAPSILKEFTHEWFEQVADVPFMMQVFSIKDKKRSLIPAVTHVDGSGRLQTVEYETNSQYHTLIAEFYKITGIPIVLNTSFNENEPVVCTPEEALSCFLRTKMDVLVLNKLVIYRNNL
jgi:carbamoyltransferase